MPGNLLGSSFSQRKKMAVGFTSPRPIRYKRNYMSTPPNSEINFYCQVPGKGLLFGEFLFYEIVRLAEGIFTVINAVVHLFVERFCKLV